MRNKGLKLLAILTLTLLLTGCGDLFYTAGYAVGETAKIASVVV